MTASAQQLPRSLSLGERYLALPQVLERVPKSYRTIYRWMDKGRFPRSYQIGPNSVAWRESEIDEWIAQQPARAS